jgi:hypothetical protein
MIKKAIFVCSFVWILLVSCSSQKEVSTQLPYEIESVYFQQWIGGQELSGSGVNFHLTFKNALPQNTTLEKLYFQDKECVFERESNVKYVAKIYSKPQNQDLILDGDSQKEYGNKAPEITQPKFELQPNEAILEFRIGTEVRYYKIVDLKEKELIAYPSTRPRN